MNRMPISPRATRRCAMFLMLLLAWMPAGPAAAQESVQRNSVKTAEMAGPVRQSMAPVVVDGEELFLVRGVTAYPASERAAEIRRRIIDVARDKTLDPANLVLQDEDDRTHFMLGQRRLFSLFDVDAELEGIKRRQLAELYLGIVTRAITNFREERGSDRLLSNSLLAVVATAVFVFLLWIAKRLFRWLVGWAERDVRRGASRLARKSKQIVHAGQIWAVVAALLRLARLLVYVLLTYVYLNTVLGLYPWTRPFAKTLLHMLIDPLQALGAGFLSALPNLIFLVVLWFVIAYVLKLVRAFFVGIEKGRIEFDNFEAEWALPTFRIVRVAIIVFAVVIAYPYIPGSDSLAFKGVSVFVGVLLSLGSSSFISNTIAGLTMTYRGAFRVGDRIKVGDTVGTVEDIKLMVTRVRTPKNERVIIPNSNILNTDVVNYTQLAESEGLMLYTTVGIGYDVPWRQVEAMLVEAAKRTDGLDHAREPFVLQTALGDYAVNYQLNVFTTDPGPMPLTYSKLHANIQDVFNENGVQIMSPAYIADPAEPKVVPKERWFEAPAKKPEPSG